MRRETKRIKNEAKKREQTGTNIPLKTSMKMEDLGNEISDLRSFNKALMTTKTAKALIVKTIHPSTAYVDLGSSGVDSSGPL